MSELVDVDPAKIFSQLESEKQLVDIVDVNPKIIDESEKRISDIVNITPLTFIEIVKSTLLNEETKNKISIKLTPEIINIINKIISLTPDTLNDIEKAAIEIIKDGKIDTNDIPQFIIVVQKIYQIVYNIKDIKIDAKKRSEFTATFLKFVIHLLVQERKIKIDNDKQEEFLKSCDILIDSCVGLLSFPKSLKTKGCLKKFFG